MSHSSAHDGPETPRGLRLGGTNCADPANVLWAEQGLADSNGNLAANVSVQEVMPPDPSASPSADTSWCANAAGCLGVASTAPNPQNLVAKIAAWGEDTSQQGHQVDYTGAHQAGPFVGEYAQLRTASLSSLLTPLGEVGANLVGLATYLAASINEHQHAVIDPETGLSVLTRDVVNRLKFYIPGASVTVAEADRCSYIESIVTPYSYWDTSGKNKTVMLYWTGTAKTPNISPNVVYDFGDETPSLPTVTDYANVSTSRDVSTYGPNGWTPERSLYVMGSGKLHFDQSPSPSPSPVAQAAVQECWTRDPATGLILRGVQAIDNGDPTPSPSDTTTVVADEPPTFPSPSDTTVVADAPSMSPSPSDTLFDLTVSTNPCSSAPLVYGTQCRDPENLCNTDADCQQIDPNAHCHAPDGGGVKSCLDTECSVSSKIPWYADPNMSITVPTPTCSGSVLGFPKAVVDAFVQQQWSCPEFPSSLTAYGGVMVGWCAPNGADGEPGTYFDVQSLCGKQ